MVKAQKRKKHVREYSEAEFENIRGNTRNRPDITINAWRCELLGTWGTTVCREFFGIKKQPCKQYQCQMMKTRLYHHQLKCRATKLNSNKTPEKINKSIMKRSSTSTEKAEPDFKPRSRPTQTKLDRNTTQDTRSYIIENNQHIEESNYDDRGVVNLQAGIINKQTDVLSRASYIDRLNCNIQELLNATIPHTNEIVKRKRMDIVKNFVDKIANLLAYINDEDYEVKVKWEIDGFLSDLKILQPHLLKDVDINESLGNSLLSYINTYNEKCHSYRKDRNSDNKPKKFATHGNDLTNELLENNITEWVESNLQITNEYDDVTNILIARIKSILKAGVKTKHELKADILNVLEELSQHWHSPKNKTNYLNKLATILTNMLYVRLEKRRYHDKHNWKSNRLKNKVNFEVMSNPKLNERSEDDVVNQITDVLFGNIDVVLHENSSDVVEDIRRILEATGEFSTAEALCLAKTLVGNVRYEYCFTEDAHTMSAGEHSNSFVVLTSEQDLSGNGGPKFHSTPADKENTCRQKMRSVKFGTPTGSSNQEADDEDTNKFITEYIENNYVIENDIVKEVLKVMLKQEIYKLNPSAKEKLYKNKTHENFNTNKFKMEVAIVKEISKWLRKMRYYHRLIQPGDETTEFVHGLARNITEIEMERKAYPNRMNYDSWLHTEIATYMLQKADEMSDEDKHKLGQSAGQLFMQIKNLRADDKDGDEITKIINEHMNKFNHMLEEDCVKKILWHRRLAEELLKMLRENPHASPTEAKHRLTSIPIPRDESVQQFKVEIKYDKVIQDWLDTFALLPSKNNEDQLTRKNMVKDLSKKIMEADHRRSRDESDENVDIHIANWISNLNLDPTVSVDIPMKISLLQDALESVRAQLQPHSPNNSMQGSIHRSRRKSKSQDLKPLDLGQQMVEAIEDWCNNLPIQENDQQDAKAKKELVATKMFQVVGSLSDDPNVTHDYKRFHDMLAKEIDAQLQSLSNYATIDTNRENIKVDLLDKIMSIKKKILDVTAGDDYVKELEKSIDASTNHPRRSKKKDPEYELLKKRMVMLWLLQNYDYAVDFHSLKYKKNLSEEIRFLSEECQNRNVFPADNEEIMNDIINHFYKAHPPDEVAIIDEVENIKMRCEIELWAKDLPLRETDGLEQLLERDQVLTILTKMLFDIEKSGEDDSNQKMKMEITKWMTKLPLLPAEKINLSEYADLLLCILKSSANARKCQRQAKPHSSFALQETLKNLKNSDVLNGIKGNLSVRKESQSIEYASPVAGPSQSRSCSQPCAVSKANYTALITTAINNWCHQLPLEFDSPNDQRAESMIKLKISQRLMQLVRELHYRPNTLNNVHLYEHYLSNEIGNILTQLIKDRIYWESPPKMNIRKYQLINELKSIRLLVKEEKDRESYMEKLKHTISSFHESMAPYSSVHLSTSAQNEILNDFMQYTNNNDFESKELYKSKINDALNNEINDADDHVDPLLATNKLIYELSKVKSPKQCQRDMTQADMKPRFSQPNPLDFHMPSAYENWHSLPHPLPQLPLPTYSFQNQNSGVSYQEPVPKNLQLLTPQPQPISTLSPRPAQLGSTRYSQEMPHQFPLNQSQASRYWSPMAPTPEIRPYPVPPPLNFSDSNISQSQRSGPRFARRNIQPDLVVTEPSYDDYPGNESRPLRERFGRPDTGSTARFPSSKRSLTECPEERQRRNIQDERWRHYDYCESCKRDRECDFDMQHPYPMPRHCMYD